MKAKSSPEMCSNGHSIFKEKCQECRKIKAGWYTYLNHLGFEDIEKGDELKESGSINLSQLKDWQTENQFIQKRNYYIWAEQKLEDGNFKNTFPLKDRLIWEYHSQGVPTRQIAKTVGYKNHSNISRKTRVIESFLKCHSVSSGSIQTDLFFWSENKFAY